MLPMAIIQPLQYKLWGTVFFNNALTVDVVPQIPFTRYCVGLVTDTYTGGKSYGIRYLYAEKLLRLYSPTEGNYTAQYMIICQ